MANQYEPTTIPSLTYHNTYFIPLFLVVMMMLSSNACRRSPETRFNSLLEKGDNHYSQHEYEEALAAWNNALLIRFDEPGLYRKMGHAYLRLAYFDKAEESFRKATIIAPNASDIWLELAKLQLAAHDITAAESSWDHINLDKNDPHLYILYGDLMAIKNHLDQAVSAYLKALNINPDEDLALIKLASCHLAQGKIDQADTLFKSVELKKTHSAKVLFEMANYYKLTQNLKKADEYFQRAINKNPEDLGLRSMLAEFYFEIGQVEQSLQTLRDVLSKAPENRFLKKFLVEVLLRNGNMDEARSILSELAEKQEKDLELSLLYGKYYLLIYNPIIAISHFKRAVEKEPFFPLAHYLLALAYMACGQISLAQNSLIQVLSLDRQFTDAELTLADIYYKKKEFDLSLEHVNRILKREPENFRAHLIIGNIFLAQDNHDQAITHFETARLLNPDSASTLYFLGLASHFSNKLKRAFRLYLTLLHKNPNFMDATLDYAMMLTKQGKAESAITYLKNALGQSQKNEFLYYILGEVYLATGNDESASKNFKKAMTINPQLIGSYIKLSEIYKRDSDSRRQVAVLKSCIENFPEFSEGYIKLGDCYRKEGDYENAIETIEEGVAINPDSAKLANALAWLYLEKKTKLNKVFNLAQFAYQRLPEDPAVADTLGWVYYHKKFFTQAVWLLKDALSRDPNNPIIHFHLGKTFHSLGNRKSAIESLNRALALELTPANRWESERICRQLQE